MSTSGSINYSVTTADIVTESLELLGVLGEGETYTTDQYTSCARTLNMMVKSWQANGLNLFAVQRAYLFLNIGQKEYSLTSTTTDNFTNTFSQTTTSASAVATATSIVVTSATGIATSSFIGIQTSGTEMFWTTVTSVAGTTVNLTGALPSNFSSGALVYAYAAKANRPMRVLEAYIRRNPFALTPIDIPIGMLSRVDYGQLATKDTQAQVVQMYFDPQRITSNVSVWPTSSTEIDYIVLLVQRTLEDFDVSTNEPDFPQEWFLPLVYNLAVLIAPKYGTPAMDYQRMQNTAMKLYADVEAWDTEQETSVYFKPDTWGSNIGRRGN
jgi:hypothetical protein